MPKNYTDYAQEELKHLYTDLQTQFDQQKACGVTYNLTRGLPSADMLDLAMPMLDILQSSSDYKSENGIDVRTYGTMEGIPEARRFMAELMDVPAESVMVGGNSSLILIHGVISTAYSKGLYNSPQPWSTLETVKVLAPVPGYDRHFGMCSFYGIELVNVDMTATGPNMDQVEELVKDPSVKGMFCVPKYSNPTGITYSDETVNRLANLKPASADFCIFYDNAYAVHDFDEANKDVLLPIYPALEKAGNTNMVIQFSSTSKITFPGGGIVGLSTGTQQLNYLLGYFATHTISFDKINQLRHVRFLQDKQGIEAIMKKAMAIAAPKFAACINIFEKELAVTGSHWTTPQGGYFISFDTAPGLATVVTHLAKEAGLALMLPGSTYPYYQDPMDSNIRIAPTAVSLTDIKNAIGVFALCVKLATVKKLLNP